MTEAKFQLGSLVATPGALSVLTTAGQSPLSLVARHVAGDWGEVCRDDARLNDQAVRSGDRIVSVYSVAGVKLYLITESDRSSTCLLQADEY